MRPFGLAMAGCEEGLERHLRARMQQCRDAQQSHFHYLEIGVAWASTLTQMVEIMKEDCQNGPLIWSAVGIDHPVKWCLGAKAFHDLMPGPENFVVGPANAYPQRLGTVVILADSAPFIWDQWRYPLDFVLIDGCHTQQYVIREFCGLENWVRPGGIVAIHDAAAEDRVVGGDDPIEVYDALVLMGLIGGNGRPGWTALDWLSGDKKRGGNSCALYRKS